MLLWSQSRNYFVARRRMHLAEMFDNASQCTSTLHNDQMDNETIFDSLKEDSRNGPSCGK